jgi:hypothetical protein
MDLESPSRQRILATLKYKLKTSKDSSTHSQELFIGPGLLALFERPDEQQLPQNRPVLPENYCVVSETSSSILGGAPLMRGENEPALNDHSFITEYSEDSSSSSEHDSESFAESSITSEEVSPRSNKLREEPSLGESIASYSTPSLGGQVFRSSHTNFTPNNSMMLARFDPKAVVPECTMPSSISPKEVLFTPAKLAVQRGFASCKSMNPPHQSTIKLGVPSVSAKVSPSVLQSRRLHPRETARVHHSMALLGPAEQKEDFGPNNSGSISVEKPACPQTELSEETFTNPPRPATSCPFPIALLEANSRLPATPVSTVKISFSTDHTPMPTKASVTVSKGISVTSAQPQVYRLENPIRHNHSKSELKRRANGFLTIYTGNKIPWKTESERQIGILEFFRSSDSEESVSTSAVSKHTFSSLNSDCHAIALQHLHEKAQVGRDEVLKRYTEGGSARAACEEHQRLGGKSGKHLDSEQEFGPRSSSPEISKVLTLFEHTPTPSGDPPTDIEAETPDEESEHVNIEDQLSNTGGSSNSADDSSFSAEQIHASSDTVPSPDAATLDLAATHASLTQIAQPYKALVKYQPRSRSEMDNMLAEVDKLLQEPNKFRYWVRPTNSELEAMRKKLKELRAKREGRANFSAAHTSTNIPAPSARRQLIPGLTIRNRPALVEQAISTLADEPPEVLSQPTPSAMEGSSPTPAPIPIEVSAPFFVEEPAAASDQDPDATLVGEPAPTPISTKKPLPGYMRQTKASLAKVRDSLLAKAQSAKKIDPNKTGRRQQHV